MADSYEKLIRQILQRFVFGHPNDYEKAVQEVHELFCQGLTKRNAELGIREVANTSYQKGYLDGRQASIDILMESPK